MNVLMVLTLILVDSVSGHPLHGLLRSSAVSLPSENFFLQCEHLRWTQTVIAVNKPHFFTCFC